MNGIAVESKSICFLLLTNRFAFLLQKNLINSFELCVQHEVHCVKLLRDKSLEYQQKDFERALPLGPVSLQIRDQALDQILRFILFKRLHYS